MPKSGILHDYDLWANKESSAQKQDTVCPLCDATPPTYQWSDYSGEAMCRTCGFPFQLRWGTDEQKEEDNYPYKGMKQEWVPVAREYYQETKAWTCFGTMMGPRPGLNAFFAWAEQKHPDMMKKED